MKTIEVIRKHIDPRWFWKLRQDEQVKILKKLFDDLCQLYNISDVQFEFVDDKNYCSLTGGGIYDKRRKTLTLYKVSLMTFLHEFAHIFFPDEKKARLWSHKAFWFSFPDVYIKSRTNGKFFHSPDLNEVANFNENFR
jgi:hypothetical protein